MADPRTIERDGRPCAQAGFTLAEMLAALTILLFGMTALLGALSSSVAQRRTTDARHELTALVDAAVLRVQHEAIKAPGGDASPFELVFEPLVDQPVPFVPGMTWSATVVADDTRPELWMVRIVARWLDAGEEVTAEFLRVLPRQLPLRERVLSFRAARAAESGR
jgi:prepilin-type N-terminal cleavage/methylation domain-containing protein